jgi:hypothetical protein
MSEEQPSYKVTDRRLFNADGTPRDLPEPEKPEATTAKTEAPTPTPAAPDSQSAPAIDTAAKPEASSATPAEDATPHAEETPEMDLPGAEDPASFASFMMSIASNAASSLGMMEHPATGKREVDLELGKHWIDILGMLQQKTRGNLLPQEQQILEGLLADLRMQYVSLTNATPKARSFSSRDITGG